MLNRYNKLDYIYLCISVLMVLFLEIRIFGSYFHLNSDLCYLPALFKSIFVDRIPFSGWILTPAPYFFPDAFIFFILRLVWNVEWTFYFYNLVMFLLFILIVYFLLKRLLLNPSTGVSCFLAILVVLLIISRVNPAYFQPFMDLLVPSFHGGATILGLFAFYCALSYYLNGLNRYWLLYFICSVLASCSDRLFIVQYTVPIVLSSVPFVISRSVAWARRICLISVLSMGSILLAYFFVPVFNKYVAYIPGSGIQLQNNMKGFTLLYERDVFHLINAQRGYFVICLMFMAATCIYVVASKSHIGRAIGYWPRCTHHVLIYLIFTVCSVGCSMLILPLVIGWIDGTCFRYLIPVYLLPCIGLSVVLSHVMVRFNGFIKVICLAIIISGGVYFQKTHGFEDLFGLKTFHCNREFDRLAQVHDLNAGLSEYWKAKLFSSVSEKGVQINQLYPDLRPRFWMFNRYWFRYDSNFQYPKYDFIIIDGLDEKK